MRVSKGCTGVEVGTEGLVMVANRFVHVAEGDFNISWLVVLLEKLKCIDKTLGCDGRLVTNLNHPAFVVLMPKRDLIEELVFFGDFSDDWLEVVFVGVYIDSKGLTFWRESDGESLT